MDKRIKICNQCKDEYVKGGSQLFCSAYCQAKWEATHQYYYDCSHFGQHPTLTWIDRIFPIYKYPSKSEFVGVIEK